MLLLYVIFLVPAVSLFVFRYLPMYGVIIALASQLALPADGPHAGALPDGSSPEIAPTDTTCSFTARLPDRSFP